MVQFLGSAAAGSAIANSPLVKAQIKATILTHSNWEFVEATTFGSAVYSADVFRCKAAGNGLGVDFYVMIANTTANGTIYCGLAEGYNTSTHLPRRPAMIGAATAQTLQADGSLMPSNQELDWVTGTYNPGGGARSVNNAATMTCIAVTDYCIAVAADAVYVIGRDVTNSMGFYAGVYESLVPTPATNDPLPLMLMGGNILSQTTGVAGTISFLRHPMRGGLSTPWACSGGGSGGTVAPTSFTTTAPFVTIGGVVSGTDSGDLYASGAGYAVRTYLLNAYTASSATAGRDKTGWLRGRMKYQRYVPQAGVFPDTVTIDGVVYYCFTQSTPHCVWAKDPA